MNITVFTTTNTFHFQNVKDVSVDEVKRVLSFTYFGESTNAERNAVFSLTAIAGYSIDKDVDVTVKTISGAAHKAGDAVSQSSKALFDKAKSLLGTAKDYLTPEQPDIETRLAEAAQELEQAAAKFEAVAAEAESAEAQTEDTSEGVSE